MVTLEFKNLRSEIGVLLKFEAKRVDLCPRLSLAMLEII